MNKTVVFLLGLPGSGKTTLLKQLEKDINIDICFPGEELRKLSKYDDDLEKRLRLGVIHSGNEEIVRKMIISKLNLLENNIIIIDGFPRSDEQIKWIEENIVLNFKITIIWLQIDKNITLKRITTPERINERPFYTEEVHLNRCDEFNNFAIKFQKHYQEFYIDSTIFESALKKMKNIINFLVTKQ